MVKTSIYLVVGSSCEQPFRPRLAEECQSIKVTQKVIASNVPNAKAAEKLSSNGQLLLLTEDNRTYLQNLATGKQTDIWKDTKAFAGSFSPDNKWLEVHLYEGRVSLFNIQTGRAINYSHSETVLNTEFSPSGRYFTSASMDRSARIVDLSTGKITAIQHDPKVNGVVYSVAFSPNEKFAATSTWDRKSVLINLTNGSRREIVTDVPANTIAFSPNNNYFAAATDRATLIVNLNNGSIKRIEEPGGIKRVGFSPDGKQLSVIARNTLKDESWETAMKKGYYARVVSIATGAEIARIDHTKEIYGVQFSPDGQWIATTSEDKEAKFADLKLGGQATIKHPRETYRAIFSPNSKFLVTMSFGNVWNIVDLSSGKQISKRYRGEYSRDEEFLKDPNYFMIGSDDKSLEIFDLRTGKSAFSLRNVTGHVQKMSDGDYSALLAGKDVVRLKLQCADASR